MDKDLSLIIKTPPQTLGNAMGNVARDCIEEARTMSKKM